MSFLCPSHARLGNNESELVIPAEICDIHTFAQCPFFLHFLHLASRAGQSARGCL